ncbi:MAG: NAD(P)-binding domain-containing protein [Bryobacterales bacterium]|nr:NAD(P)-binding domain-containing protein [Bryobacterales bacterium]
MSPQRPVVNQQFESNVPGLFIVGDLAGAPVVKIAMEQGHRVAARIASLPDARSSLADSFDLLVIGAGAAGLNAALTAQERGLRVLVVEQGKLANTIEDFPEGKWIYAEPDSRAVEGKLWLEGAAKEELLERWSEAVSDSNLNLRTGEAVIGVKRRTDAHFDVTTSGGLYRARRVILATGQRGNPRRLVVPGEDRSNVYHRLYSPKLYQEQNILVVGGGNSAVEAALALCAQNYVTLSYRGKEFTRLFKENRRRLEEAERAGRLRVLRESVVESLAGPAAIRQGAQRLELAFDHAFVLIGAELPTRFLKSLGIRLENEWTGSPVLAVALTVATLTSLAKLQWLAVVACLAALALAGWRRNRYALLGLTFLVSYTIYGAKLGTGAEFWPYRGWGYEFFSFFDRPMAFWYTVSYTAVMTVFGIQAAKRWGWDRKDRFQAWRYASLIGFQWVFFFLIPEVLFQWAVKYEWVGRELAADPNFANNAWRSYGIVYAWPLFFYTFFGAPHQIWIVWGLLLSFVILPVLVLFHGKRYCSWICGCGGLAETLGDRWRHLAPKGHTAIQWEKMNAVVLGAAVVVTLLMVGQDVVRAFRTPAGVSIQWYRLVVDVWLVGIIPVALYPFFGGKIWCRYWCPLAKMMEIFSAWFTRFKASRFAIQANDKCIACGECTRYCQVGIDVMQFAMKQETLTNLNSSCIGCGICITVCPMDVLTFGRPQPSEALIQIQT